MFYDYTLIGNQIAVGHRIILEMFPRLCTRKSSSILLTYLEREPLNRGYSEFSEFSIPI